MSEFITVVTLTGLGCAVVPGRTPAGEAAFRPAAAAPKKKSRFLGFTRRAAEEIAGWLLPRERRHQCIGRR